MIKISDRIEEADTLPGEFYNSAEYLDLCRERVFQRTWQVIGDKDTCKLPQFAQPFDFLDGFVEEPLLLVRDKEDQLHCLSNVCTHRGNILVDSPCQLNGSISCCYHGRRFGLDGKFLHMPETEGMKEFPSERDNLPWLEVKKWKQFLFTSLDPAFPFEELVAEMDQRVGWMPVENFVLDESRSQDYLVRANWALYCDNYLEGFHIPFIHKDLSRSLDFKNYSYELYPYANLQVGVGKSGETCFDLPKSSPDHGKSIAAYYYWLFPNLMFNFYPWGLSLNIIRPVRHNLTKVSFRSYVWDPSKLDQGAGALLDRVEREDEAVVEKVQKGTNSLLYKKGRYSVTMEKGVHHFHQLLSRFLSSTSVDRPDIP